LAPGAIRGDGSEEIIFKVQWLGGEKSWVKMDDLRTHDPFLVVCCGLRGKLIEKPGWEWAELHLNSNTKITSMIRACKMSVETACKFGVQAPRNTKESIKLDTENGNTLWADLIKTEFKQIKDYETFWVLEENEPMPAGCKRIPCNNDIQCIK
jgi:hypothetical protein